MAKTLKSEKIKVKADTENEKEVLRFIYNGIINEKFFEFTSKEIREGVELGERKTGNILTTLVTKGILVERKRQKNDMSFFTLSDLVRVCKNWCKQNKGKYI